MSLALGAAIYVIIWWIVFFMVLPIGMRTQDEAGEVEPGTPASAPARFSFGRKVAATTLAAGVVFAMFYWVVTSGRFSLDDIPFLPRFEKLSDG